MVLLLVLALLLFNLLPITYPFFILNIGQQGSIDNMYSTNPTIKSLDTASRTGFGAYHRILSNFNPSFNGDFNYRNNNNNKFFLNGGEHTNRHPLSPQGAPSRIPKEIIEGTREEEDLVEEPIKVLDGPGDILVLLSERGKTSEILEALEVY
jgi:hypothetical protein